VGVYPVPQSNRPGWPYTSSGSMISAGPGAPGAELCPVRPVPAKRVRRPRRGHVRGLVIGERQRGREVERIGLSPLRDPGLAGHVLGALGLCSSTHASR
jgi:hypothetical protein